MGRGWGVCCGGGAGSWCNGNLDWSGSESVRGYGRVRGCVGSDGGGGPSRESVRESVRESARGSVRGSVRASVRASVRESVREGVRASVRESLRASVHASIDSDGHGGPGR